MATVAEPDAPRDINGDTDRRTNRRTNRQTATVTGTRRYKLNAGERPDRPALNKFCALTEDKANVNENTRKTIYTKKVYSFRRIQKIRILDLLK